MPTKIQSFRLALLAALLAAASSCGGEPGAARETGPPPEMKAMSVLEIQQQRADLDRQFASAPESPIPAAARATFQGLSYYDHDPGLSFVVHLERLEEPVPIRLVTTEGQVRPASRIGSVRVRRDGSEHELQVYHLRDSPAEAWGEPFLPFMDATTGSETYPAGRYVELAPGPGDWYLLDFNRAYNPHCAYGRTGYACPRTPEENRLPFAVRAGEKGPEPAGHDTGGQNTSVK